MTTQETSQTESSSDKTITDDRSHAKTLMLCVAVTLLAACLRFYGLSEWSFANDELATFIESDRLFGTPEDGEFTIYDVLPRLIPNQLCDS